MSTFFSKFPLINYDIDGKGTYLTLTNISRNVDVDDVNVNSSIEYSYYDIRDGERPDTVSYNLYGSVAYYWTFFILNNDLRGGINYSWPLSSHQLETIFETEYDPYSVITFKPDIEGFGADSGLIQLVPLKPEYLSYLRIVNKLPNITQVSAKIVKYDSSRLQLVISDIVNTVDGTAADRTAFITSDIFYIDWHNPFEVNTDEYDACEALKRTYIQEMAEIILEYDAGIVPNPDLFDEIQELGDVDAEAYISISSYILTKQYLPAGELIYTGPNVIGRRYCWSSYRNAASIYFQNDLLTNEDVAIDAWNAVVDGVNTYITFYDEEVTINSKKERIRIIQPDRITNFVNEYYRALNGS